MESDGPKRGQWQWAGLGPPVRPRLTPHHGFEAEPREAMRQVEEYYHRLMQNNERRG
ncbi:hypothetical protein RLEG12_08810 (plasmid) [Rhizobium leguminosarum bv. trifolii CB782]|nr:hypothetical protein RLEG12_08810 [Rhizobium leguminosarum bv. trifolii CB782]